MPTCRTKHFFQEDCLSNFLVHGAVHERLPLMRGALAKRVQQGPACVEFREVSFAELRPAFRLVLESFPQFGGRRDIAQPFV